MGHLLPCMNHTHGAFLVIYLFILSSITDLAIFFFIVIVLGGANYFVLGFRGWGRGLSVFFFFFYKNYVSVEKNSQ